MRAKLRELEEAITDHHGFLLARMLTTIDPLAAARATHWSSLASSLIRKVLGIFGQSCQGVLLDELKPALRCSWHSIAHGSLTTTWAMAAA